MRTAAKLLLVAIPLALILGSIASGLATVIGRPSHYQGVQFTCYGVEVGSVSGHDVGQGTTVNKFFTGGEEDQTSYTNDGTHKISASYFLGTSFDLDIDEVKTHTPNLRGSVDIPKPSELYDDEYGKGHVRYYEWEVDNTHYRMDLWILDMDINIVASADEWEKDGRFHNTNIWLKAEAFNPQYFYVGGEGVSNPQVYFSIAAIEVYNHKLGAGLFTQDEMQSLGIKDVNTPTGQISVNINKGLELFLQYTDPNPLTSTTDPNGQTETFESFYYRGATLDPEVFKPVFYVPIHLSSWGTEDGDFGPWYWWKTDALTIQTRVHVFTVGSWEVMKEEHEEWGQLIGSYGERSTWDKFIDGVAGFFGGIFDWLGDWGILIIIIIVVIVVVLLTVFLRLIPQRRRRPRTHSHRVH